MQRWGGIFVVLAACSAAPTGTPTPTPVARTRVALGPSALAAIAQRPEVVAVDGDVALVCSEAAPASDSEDAVPDCDAARIGADGALVELGRGGLLAAARLDDRQLVLLTRERSLRVRAGEHETEIARDVADPRVAPDRRAIAFTQLPAGATTIDPSTTGHLVLLDLDRGTRRTITDHPMDSSPFPRPGSDDVLFVSGRTGLASLWLASPGRPARQLTNVGTREVGPGFVPVPGRELTWLDAHVAVYTATYDGVSTLWAIDVDRGRAAQVADARLPQVVDGGDAIVALARDGAPTTLDRAAIAHALEVTP